MTLYCVNLAKPEIIFPECPSLFDSEFSFTTGEIHLSSKMHKWVAAIFIPWRSVQGQARLHFMHIVADLLTHLLDEGQQPGVRFPQLLPDCSFDICKSQVRNMERCQHILQATHLKGWQPRKADPGPNLSSWVLVCHHKFRFSLRTPVSPLCLLCSRFPYFTSVFS